MWDSFLYAISLLVHLRPENSPLSLINIYLARPPKKRSAKTSSNQATDNSWLTQFCHENIIPDSLMKVLAKHQITSESFLAEVTEQDLVEITIIK